MIMPSNVTSYNYYNNNYDHCCNELYYNNNDNNDNDNEKHTYDIWNTKFEIDTKYIPIKPLGKGAFGVVCATLNISTKERVAIKKIANVFANKLQALNILREIKILRHVHHQNIITLKDIMITNPHLSFEEIYLVFELMDSDLGKIISSNLPLPKNRRKFFMLQILKGVSHLHSANILHRDLKPENILVTDNCDIKICDLGLAITGKGKEYAGTLRYQAPELVIGRIFGELGDYDTSVDIWSVGCIFAELIGRKVLFCGRNRSEQIDKIFDLLSEDDITEMTKVKNLSDLLPNADPLEIDLLKRMLRIKATERITAADALRHPYFANLYDPRFEDLQPSTLDLDSLDDATLEEIRNLMVVEMNLLHLFS